MIHAIIQFSARKVVTKAIALAKIKYVGGPLSRQQHDILHKFHDLIKISLAPIATIVKA
jgi:hypothetical protein